MRIPRDEALDRIAREDVARLPLHARAAFLAQLMRDDWSDDAGWAALDPSVRLELEQRCLRRPPTSRRYDPALAIVCRDRLRDATNAFLAAVLGPDVTVVGDEPALAPCPCCALRTLASRGAHDICPVCWWVDDGRAEADADVETRGANRLSLAQARRNYETHGLAEPWREELKRAQAPAAMYARDLSTSRPPPR